MTHVKLIIPSTNHSDCVVIARVRSALPTVKPSASAPPSWEHYKNRHHRHIARPSSSSSTANCMQAGIPRIIFALHNLHRILWISVLSASAVPAGQLFLGVTVTCDSSGWSAGVFQDSKSSSFTQHTLVTGHSVLYSLSFLRERCSKHLPKPDPTAEVFRSFCPNCKPLYTTVTRCPINAHR